MYGRPWIMVTLVVGLALASRAAAAEELIRLPTRPGVTQPYWLVAPAGAPVASVILFTGGNGLLGSQNRPILKGMNFLVRSRDRFAAQGFLVAVVDAPSDHLSGLDDFRASEDHARDIAAVIADLRRRAAVPVWLVGTSMGTISAANAAARLKQGGADGLVLTSTILAASRRVAPLASVVDVAAITAPTIVVHNREDACPLCPFALVDPFMAKLEHAARKQLIAVSGGDPPLSDPCEAQSRHGYLGIEDEVVGDIGRAIKLGG